MKRCLFVIAIAFAAVAGSAALHAQEGQPRVYTNSKPMTFGHNLKTYYLVQKNNINAMLAAVPDDKFYATPPGYSKDIGTEEQASIGAEVQHMTDTQYRMCTIMATGKNPPRNSLPGTVVMAEAMPTKADMLAALKKSFDCMDQLVDNFDDAKITSMVNSQHSMQPYGTTIFNTVSHDREVYGRIKSYMVTFGIKAPREIDARDPDNQQDLYYCGGTESKTPDNCK